MQRESASPSLVLVLVLAMVALAWQLVAYYAREILPDRERSAAVLDRFDGIAGSLPLASGSAGPIIGMALALLALVLLGLGLRRGHREPALQGVAATVAALALFAPLVLPAIAG